MNKQIEKLLAAMDKAAPTRENLEKFKQKIAEMFGSVEDSPYVVDSAFEMFETSVKICARG